MSTSLHKKLNIKKFSGRWQIDEGTRCSELYNFRKLLQICGSKIR
jgi:hypothetical protein